MDCIYIYANLLIYCAIMFLNEVLEGSCSSIFIVIIISRVDVAQVLGYMLIFSPVVIKVRATQRLLTTPRPRSHVACIMKTRFFTVT